MSGHAKRNPWKWLFWAQALAGLAFVVVADPLHWHTFDTRLHDWVAGYDEVTPLDAAGPNLWTCSMHPQVIRREPGACPICEMPLTLIRLEELPGATNRKSGARKVAFYRNPMDPSVTSPVPRQDEMGMDYVPVYEDELVDAGQSEIRVDPAVVQQMNVRTEVVERRDVRHEIRTVGYLEYDQQKMVTVTPKYKGWVEEVFVNYVGEPIREGEPLFSIYSPQLVQTVRELRSTRDFAGALKGAPETARAGAESLLAAARTRLALWDVSPDQIENIVEQGDSFRTLAVTSPASGIVMKRMAGLEGMAVEPGMELYHIADLSSLWLSVEAFEDQLAWLREGSVAQITLSYLPGESFTGRVRFIEPQVSEATRTVSLRLEVPNSDGRLRAGMYATVRFRPVIARDVLVVPSQAVLRTGERDVVIVALGEGRFLPRPVRLGSEGEGGVAVLDGLEEGERVVTSAQFLLDSESRLREAIQKLISEEG